MTAHVKPLQGLHPGRVRLGERVSHSHLQRKGVNTLKVNFSENQRISARENIGRHIEEIAGVLCQRNPDIGWCTVQQSSQRQEWKLRCKLRERRYMYAELLQLSRWGDRREWDSWLGRVESAPSWSVCGIAGIPRQFHTCHAFHTRPPEICSSSLSASQKILA